MSESTTVNVCRQLTNASGTSAVVELGGTTTAEFKVGRLVLLMQMQDVFATTNDATPVAVAGSAGLWEIARITAVAPSGTVRTLTLNTALTNTYGTAGNRSAQACTVPEYSSVSIQDGKVLGASKWDGAQGGVVALFVDGALDLNSTGEISADVAGFRGGVITGNAVNQDTVSNDNTGGLGGGKGESL
ncbi:MAG TPA: hypothetical protein VMV18_02780, partial [bacterium]|nr:hypothetical protein [bacterium]